jgi:PAS domain S-box-containing protein
MQKSFLKIILPTILTILLFILTIFLIIIPRFQQNILNGKREMIKELTNSAWSILSKYENDERDSVLTREEAQNTARSRIQYLRYGEENKDYFWITDMTPVMIMHPFRNDLNGQDLTNFTDPHGKKLFVEFVETVKISENGYVDYMWQWKDDSLRIVPKLSYVKLFKPWGWVIGTGIYIEDVKKEISSLTQRMIWISITISIFIAFLLLYISKQSLNIEHKRIQAEKELHESKEKYRTLVEAASEGLIMLTDGRISFSNNIISKITGFEKSELADLSINEIISRNNNEDIIETFSENPVKEGKFELNLKNKTGGFVEVIITSSTTEFLGRSVNIIIVKDISVDRISEVTKIDYQKLIGTLNIGFFKSEIDSKGKFIFANETAVKILGFNSFAELSKNHILELLAESEERKHLRKILEEQGFLKNKVLKIIKQNGDYSVISVSLVLLNKENSDKLICDGIIEDITLSENEKLQTKNLIAELKTNDLILGQPVKALLNPVCTLDADSTLNDVIRVLQIRKTDNILLTKNNNDYIGIITRTDIQERILSLNLSLENPAYLIMSSPIFYISENTSMLDAIRICEEKRIDHLIARNESEDITGVFKTSDVYKTLINSYSFLNANIRKAETTEELKLCYDSLLMLLIPLIQSEISVKYITKITASFSDEVIKRIIELTINETGPPPVNFSFICLGSEGRKEDTLFTDQDNAIVFRDVPKDQEINVSEYFRKLGERVCNSLNYIGYSYCKGNIMAKNPQWCKPLSAWERYFNNWITTPEAQNLLDASVFFDFRNIYGDESITERLRKTVSGSIKDNPLFLYHLAFNTSNIKPQHISSGNILSDKNADQIDLKSAVSPLIMFARTYSLQNNISHTNTIERLTALKERNIISEKTIDEIIFTYNYLMKLRFRNQAEMSDNNLPLSNSLNSRNLIDQEVFLLKKVLTAIPEYQNKIKSDFRITS